MVVQRTADCVGDSLEQFITNNQFRHAAFLKVERDAFKLCEALVFRLNGKVSDDVFVERRLGCDISLIERGVVVFVCGIHRSVNVVVVIGCTPGDIKSVSDVVALLDCPVRVGLLTLFLLFFLFRCFRCCFRCCCCCCFCCCF